MHNPKKTNQFRIVKNTWNSSKQFVSSALTNGNSNNEVRQISIRQQQLKDNKAST